MRKLFKEIKSNLIISIDLPEIVSERYIELYENIMGETFIKADVSNIQERIEGNVLKYLKNFN